MQNIRERIAETSRAMAVELLEETKAICRIPAPTFAEGERARYLQGRLQELGLREVEVDGLTNVTGVLPGTGGGKPLMLAAHIDTVFPAGTDVEPKFDGRYWRAPGIRDNSASAAVTLLTPELLRRAGVSLAGDLIVAFTVGEEGLGNLRGIRAVMERFSRRVRAVLAVDGNLGQIVHIGISVRRLELRMKTEGGHSWGDAGKPSALHVLARIAGQISRLPLPANPKTTLNIGTFHGGTSVNAIAQEAHLLLDLRSVSKEAVAELEDQVREVVAQEVNHPDVHAEVEVVGDRPGGTIPRGHPLVQTLLAACREAGVDGRPTAASTDANIPLSMGIPCAALGVSKGGGVHTVDEYLDPATLVPGAHALALSVPDLMRS